MCMVRHPQLEPLASKFDARHGSPSADDGFSLLEMTIALFLMGLLLTLVAQSGVSMFERWNLTLTERRIRNQISVLSVQAFASRQAFTLDEAISGPIQVPNGWLVLSLEPVKYAESGVCSGGEIEIHSPKGRTWRYSLEPPYCRVG